MSNLIKKTLFNGIIRVLILTTLVPVVIVGVYMFSIDEQLVKKELLERQRVLVTSVENNFRSFLDRRIGLLRNYAQIHQYVLGAGADMNHLSLNYILSEYPEIEGAAVLDKDGRIYAQEGEVIIVKGRNGEMSAIQNICFQNKMPYVGVVRRKDQAQNTMLLAIPIKSPDGAVRAALAVQMSVENILKSVGDMFPPEGEITAAVFSQDYRVLYSSEELSQLMLENYRAMPLESNSQFRVGAKNFISTKGVVTSLGWTVYVAQPGVQWSRIIFKDKNSVSDIVLIVVGVSLFVFLAGRFFIKPVVDPLKTLQKTAAKVGKEDFDSLPRIEDFPTNEIGDLARSFLIMSNSLKRRKEEAEDARREIEDVNKSLEKKVEERTMALQNATEALVQKERLAAIGEMASIISHEIRNPLAVINNCATLIKAMSAKENPKLDKQFNIIEAEVRQANRIIEEVLGYARSKTPVITKVELNGYLKEIIFSYPWPKNIKLNEHLLKERVYAEIDSSEIKQALHNLIGNAIEVMPNGGELTLCLRAGAKAVEIYVEDFGPGMSEDVRQKLFQAFFTTKARGTGLGLAVVKKAVSNSHGKVFVKSEAGKGTRFSLFFKKV